MEEEEKYNECYECEAPIYDDKQFCSKECRDNNQN